MKTTRIIVTLEMLLVAALLLSIVYVGRSFIITHEEDAIIDPLAELSPEERAIAEARGALPLEVEVIDPESMIVTESLEPVVVEDIDEATWEARMAEQNVPDVISGEPVTSVENTTGSEVSVTAELNEQNEVLAGPVVVRSNTDEAGTTAVELQVVVVDIDTEKGIIAAQERNSESLLRIYVGSAPIAIGSTTVGITDLTQDDILAVRGTRMGGSNEIEAASITVTGMMSYFVLPTSPDTSS